MSGWRRLWIVLSVLFAIPTYIIAADNDDARGSASNLTFEEVQKTYVVSLIKEPCEANTATSFTTVAYAPNDPVTRYNLEASCKRAGYQERAFMIALIPAFLMALAGLTARWVYRGFRPRAEK